MRHCRTSLNDEKKLCGSSDPTLTKWGVSQGLVVGSWLTHLNVKKILCSPTERAIETAKLICSNIDVSMKVCDELKERNYGFFEKLGLEQLVRKRKNMQHIFTDPTQDWDGVNGVESDQEVYERMNKLIRKEYPCSSGNSVLLITHAGAIKSYLYGCLEISPNRSNCIKIRNASFLLLDFDSSNKLQIKGLYDFDFLKQIQA